jgi:hypothetical protein
MKSKIYQFAVAALAGAVGTWLYARFAPKA